MPSMRPEYLSGHAYHFYNRGAHRLSLFREADNYLLVLRMMKTYCRSLRLTPIAYCLLPNHYHWLIRQDGEDPARLLPQRVYNAYSKAYNKRYGHSGTLFEGSYRVKAVESEVHLVHLCRYIHANPVVHGLVESVTGWPYSNYHEWIGQRAGTLVDRDFVTERFPRAGEYMTFVEDYVASRQLPDDLDGYLATWEGLEQVE